MRPKTLVLLLAVLITAGYVVLRGLREAPAVGAAPQRSGWSQATQPAPPGGDQDRQRLLAVGRQLFVERCGSCHNERGDKPLRSGPPLNERALTPEVIASNVNPRVKDGTDEQRRAVSLYIESFLKK